MIDNGILSVALVVGALGAGLALTSVNAASPGTAPPATLLAQAATPAPAEPAAPAAAIDEATIAAQGPALYETNCESCHGRRGAGDIGPALAGNSRLGDAVFVHRQIAQGGGEMPPFDGALSHEEIMIVGSYVRTSWGNAFGPLTEENIVAPAQ